jgi:hypothetical protein
MESRQRSEEELSIIKDDPKLELANKWCKTTVYLLMKFPMTYVIDDLRNRYREDDPLIGLAAIGGLGTGIILTITGAALATIAVPIAALVDHYDQKKIQLSKDKISFFKTSGHHNINESLATEELYKKTL